MPPTPRRVGGSNIPYNPNQPIGQQFYATNATQISNDFYSVGPGQSTKR